MWNKGRKIAINKMHSASLHLPYEGEGGLLMANYGYAKWKIKMCRCSWLGNIGTIRQINWINFGMKRIIIFIWL